jgi:hypothetical protein
VYSIVVLPSGPVVVVSPALVKRPVFLLGDTGLEPNGVTNESGKQLQNGPHGGGALSGADKLTSGDYGPDLQRVIDAWPTLPKTVRRDILAVVEALQVKK